MKEKNVDEYDFLIISSDLEFHLRPDGLDMNKKRRIVDNVIKTCNV